VAASPCEPAGSVPAGCWLAGAEMAERVRGDAARPVAQMVFGGAGQGRTQRLGADPGARTAVGMSSAERACSPPSD
jgi:hypothetical protein